MELPDALHRASPVELKARVEAERLGRPFLLLVDDGGAQRIVELPAEDGAARPSAAARRATSRCRGTARPRASTRCSSACTTSGASSTTAARATARSSTASAVSGRRRLRDGDVLRVGRTADRVPRAVRG